MPDLTRSTYFAFLSPASASTSANGSVVYCPIALQPSSQLCSLMLRFRREDQAGIVFQRLLRLWCAEGPVAKKTGYVPRPCGTYPVLCLSFALLVSSRHRDWSPACC